jgi:hypothetical protein
MQPLPPLDVRLQRRAPRRRRRELRLELGRAALQRLDLQLRAGRRREVRRRLRLRLRERVREAQELLVLGRRRAPVNGHLRGHPVRHALELHSAARQAAPRLSGGARA